MNFVFRKRIIKIRTRRGHTFGNKPRKREDTLTEKSRLLLKLLLMRGGGKDIEIVDGPGSL